MQLVARRPQTRGSILWLSLSLLLSTLACVRGVSKGFLLVSSPSTKHVYYARLLTAIEQARGDVMIPVKLAGSAIATANEPRGLAVDSLRGVLYVADSAAGAIVAMRIYEDGDVLTVLGAKRVVPDVTAHWLALDSLGTLYFTDTTANKISSISAECVSAKLGSLPWTGPETVVLYDGTNVPKVKMPKGLAVDGFNVFWANGESGTVDGAVVQAPVMPPTDAPETAVNSLTSNVEAAYGVCLTPTRVFFTDASQAIYSTRTKGGTVSVVSDRLTQPRGCVYDGDGSVFIADEAGNKVFSFAGSAPNLGSRKLYAALNVQGAFGVAVYSPSAAGRSHVAAMVLLLVASLHFCWPRL